MTTSDLPTGTPAGHRTSDGDDEPPHEPNYLLRRAFVIGSVVAVVAAIAIGVGTLLERDDDPATSGGAPADWNAVVLLDTRTGQVIVTDAAGTESTRFASGIRSPTDAMAIGPTLVASSAEAASVVDLGSESTQVFDFATTPDGVVMPAGSAATMLIGSSNGDRAVLVHAPSGDLIDTEASAPIAGAVYDVSAAVATPSGREVLVTDSGNFQSVLFSFDREQPSYFPGRALAVDESLVVTTQNVGTESSLSVFDHDGEPVIDARTASVRAAMVAGNHVVLVTLDGDVIDLDTTSGDTSAVGTTTVGPIRSATVSPNGDRLVVVGEGGTAVIDEGGNVLAELPGTAPIGTGINELATRTSVCVVVVDQLDAALTLVSLDDGSIVAEADGPDTTGSTDGNGEVLAAADGCTAATPAADGVTLVAAGGAREIAGSTDLRSLSPDAAAIVVADDDRLELHAATIDEASDPTDPVDPTEPVDLGPDSRLVIFTSR